MSAHCVSCNKPKRVCYMFEICMLEDGDDEFTDTLGRVVVCVDCVKGKPGDTPDPVTAMTIVQSLIDETAT